VQGEATVVLDETIAQGDPACRLQVMLGPAPDDVAGNTYHWLPAGTAAFDDDPAPRLELTVSLPRESHSVPVVRRLAAQLRAFKCRQDISDVDRDQWARRTWSPRRKRSCQVTSSCLRTAALTGGGAFDAMWSRPGGRRRHGRGISLMRALVDNVNFANDPRLMVVHGQELTYDSSTAAQRLRRATCGRRFRRRTGVSVE
jgi:hypothetical protein